MIDKKKFEEFLAFQTEIEAKAMEILIRYKKIRNEIVSDPLNESLSFTSIDSEWMQFNGEEFWKFGGHEYVEETLPTAYLFDPDWESKVIVQATAERKILDERREKAIADELHKAEMTIQKIREAHPNLTA